MKFEIDPEDVLSTGCDSCYNARLDGLYIEFHGRPQPSNVPSRYVIFIIREIVKWEPVLPNMSLYK